MEGQSFSTKRPFWLAARGPLRWALTFNPTKAERLAQEELQGLGWTVQDLLGRRKSDPQKVRIAVRLRRETTITLEWIAQRLCMGTPTHVAALLQREQQRAQKTRSAWF